MKKRVINTIVNCAAFLKLGHTIISKLICILENLLVFSKTIENSLQLLLTLKQKSVFNCIWFVIEANSIDQYLLFVKIVVKEVNHILRCL